MPYWGITHCTSIPIFYHYFSLYLKHLTAANKKKKTWFGLLKMLNPFFPLLVSPHVWNVSPTNAWGGAKRARHLWQKRRLMTAVRRSISHSSVRPSVRLRARVFVSVNLWRQHPGQTKPLAHAAALAASAVWGRGGGSERGDWYRAAAWRTAGPWGRCIERPRQSQWEFFFSLTGCFHARWFSPQRPRVK